MAADRGAEPVDGSTASTADPAVPASPPAPELPPAFERYAADDLPNATPRGPGKDGVLEATFAWSGASGRAGSERGERGTSGESGERGTSAESDEHGASDSEPHAPTRLVRDRAEVPLHHVGTLDHDPLGPTLCVQEPTGGVAQGDRHRIGVEARPGSRAAITTQAATKVHGMHSDYAHLDAELRVGTGAHVEYVPGPAIVNEDARCLQTSRVALARGASAILSDVLVTDGLSDHEPFGFDHYHARLEARHAGELVCADAVDLRPTERDPRDPAGVGEYTVVGSLYALAPDAAEGSLELPAGVAERAASLEGSVDDLADRLPERVDEVAADVAGEDSVADAEGDDDSVAADEPLRGGASTLPHGAGVGVRVLGHRSEDVRRALGAAREAARRALLGVECPPERRCR